MKAKIFIIVVAIFLSIQLQAKRIPGQIIVQNDTIPATFRVPTFLFSGEPSYLRLQRSIKYFDQNKNKKKLKPTEASSILFHIKDMDVRMVSVYHANTLLSKPQGKPNFFMKLEIDGPLRLFKFYYEDFSDGIDPNQSAINEKSSTLDYYYLLQKNHGTLQRVSTLTFRKTMSNYLSDCPSVQKRIESQELRRRDLKRIVREYNEHCGDVE